MLTDTARLHPEVRTFLEELVREHPGEDVRILAARRRQEHSEEERERLTPPCMDYSRRGKVVRASRAFARPAAKANSASLRGGSEGDLHRCFFVICR